MVLDIASIERELEAVTRQWQLNSETHDRITQQKRSARLQQQHQQQQQQQQLQEDQRRTHSRTQPHHLTTTTDFSKTAIPPPQPLSLSPRRRSTDARRTQSVVQPVDDEHARNRRSWIVLPTWEQPASPHSPHRSPHPAASYSQSPSASSTARSAARSPAVTSRAHHHTSSALSSSTPASEARSHLRLLHSRARSVSRPATAAADTRIDLSTARASAPHQPGPQSQRPSRGSPQVRRSSTAPARSAARRTSGSGSGNAKAVAAAAPREQKQATYPVPSAAFLDRVQAWQDKYEQQRTSRQPTTQQLREDEEWEQCTFMPHVSPPPQPEPAAEYATTRASRLAAEHTYHTHIAPPSSSSPVRSEVRAVVSRQHVDSAHQRYVEQRQLDSSYYPRINAVSLVLANTSRDTSNPGTVRTRESERQIVEAERELTFQPAVNEQSERLTAVLPPDFLFRQHVLQLEEERREEERREMEQQRFQRKAPFQPQLDDDVWRQQAMVGQPVDAVERLYDWDHERRVTGSWKGREKNAVQATYADCTFRPRINSNSTVLAYAKMQREASSSGSSSSSSSRSTRSSSHGSRLSGQDYELADDGSQVCSASPRGEQSASSHSPAINFRSRLLCLDNGRLTEHQQQSEQFQHQLVQHHTQRSHASQQLADRHCTFTPAILPPPGPTSPHPVPGVTAYMHHRALVNEQREWRVRRERQVFMVDAMERPGRRGGTEVREFRLRTDERGRKQREQLVREQEARRNRDHY